MIGEFLRGRRERFGFSPHDVASFAGLAVADVERAEAGASLSLGQLHSFARALAFDEALLLRGEVDRVPDARTLPGWFRSHEPLHEESLSPRDARLLARATELGQIGAFLWSLVEDQPLPPIEALRRPTGVTPTPAPWQQGYLLGAKARELISQSRDPLKNVQESVESLGVHITRIPLDSREHEAVSIYRPGALPIILLNENHSRVRSLWVRRAILAHELGHLLHDSGERDLSPTPTSASEQRLAIEQRAKGFAPAFLAPPQWVEERLRSARVDDTQPEDVVRHIAATWGFTREGAIWHAKNCKLIDADVAESLVADPARSTTVSRLSTDFEQPPARHNAESLGLDVSMLVEGYISDLVLRAYKAEAISRGRAQEILTMD